MEYFHHERGLAMSTVCRLVDSAAEATFEPARKEAGLKLRPIVHAYKGLTSETRAGETDDIFNILEDLNTPENAAALATLSLTPFITRAATLNQEYYDLLGEREQEWQHTHHGTLLPIRRETDTVLFDLTDATNLHYKIAPSPALEALVDAVNAALQPFKRIVARRHKHSSSSSPGGGDNSGGGDDEGTDEGIQKPENTPPPASNTPQNPTDEPHHLDPNEHPAAGE
jgi:hypothetical protein